MSTDDQSTHDQSTHEKPALVGDGSAHPSQIGVPSLPPSNHDPVAPIRPERERERERLQPATPAPSDATAAATAYRAVVQSRAQAERKRKRQRRTVRLFGVLVFLVLGVGGIVAYDAYQEQQDRQAAERAQGDLFAADDDVLSVARDLDAGGQPRGADNAIVSTDDRESAKLSIVRWDSLAPDSSFVEYAFTHDFDGDVFHGFRLPSDPSDRPIFVAGTDDRHLAIVYTDGTVERFPRSAISLQPEPDDPLGRLLTAEDVIPSAAVDFTTALGDTGSDDGLLQTVSIDVTAWRQSDSASYERWVSLWASEGPLAAGLFDPSGRETASSDMSGIENDRSSTIDANRFKGIATDQGAVVAFIVSPSGSMKFVLVHDAESATRTMWTDLGPAEDRVGLTVSGDTWTAAPTG